MFQFFTQGFFPFDGQAVFEDLMIVFFVDVRFLLDIIQRDISIFLKKTDFAHDVFRNAARRQIAHASVLKDQPYAGDIFKRCQDAGADGVDLPNGGRNEPQDNVDIVDHQIHDDADVQRTVGKFIQAVAFNEKGIVRKVFDRLKGGVEALDVSNLEFRFFCLARSMSSCA